MVDSATANDAPDQQAGPASQVVAEFSPSYLVLCPITCFLLPFQEKAEDATAAEAEVVRWNAARQSNMMPIACLCLVNFASSFRECCFFFCFQQQETEAAESQAAEAKAALLVVSRWIWQCLSFRSHQRCQLAIRTPTEFLTSASRMYSSTGK